MKEDLKTVALWIAAVIVAIVVLIGSKRLARAAFESESAWRWTLITVVAATAAWRTFRKLTSDKPVDDDGYWHFGFAQSAAGMLVGGGALALAGDGWQRPLGLLAHVAGIVMAVAAWRDYRRWRAAVERERGAAAEQARAAAEAPRPRAW